MSQTLPADHARRSDAISIARVICIVGVVYVHAWTGRTGGELEQAIGTTQESLRWVLMDVLGRCAVPLLGLISGWLVAGSRRTRDWRSHIGRKARTIVLPMALWNALAIVLVGAAAYYLDLRAPTPKSVGWVLDEMFSVTRNPHINVQMPFLRDLFLCMVLAPLLVRLPKWALVAVVTICALCHVADVGPPVFMRVSILMFFTIGILVRRDGIAERSTQWPLLVTLLPFLVLMPVRLYLSVRTGSTIHNPEVAALDLAVRVAASLAFWRLAWGLAATGVGRAIVRLEPYAFLTFCAHLILIWLGGPLIGRVTGPLGSPLYPAFLLAQPFLVLGTVIVLGKVLHRLAPRAAGILSGGRLAQTNPE